MHILDILLRTVIQTAVMGVWGLFGLAFVAGLAGRVIRWIWMKTHPVTAVVHIIQDEVVDAEWVREL
jgi:hypothetical protein